MITNESLAKEYAPRFASGDEAQLSLVKQIAEKSGMSASGFRADFFWYALSARDLDNQPRLLQGNDDARETRAARAIKGILNTAMEA